MVETTDKVVLAVIDELDERSCIGIEKYKTTLHENNNDDFLQHLLEELLDGANYVKKLQFQLNPTMIPLSDVVRFANKISLSSWSTIEVESFLNKKI